MSRRVASEPDPRSGPESRTRPGSLCPFRRTCHDCGLTRSCRRRDREASRRSLPTPRRSRPRVGETREVVIPVGVETTRVPLKTDGSSRSHVYPPETVSTWCKEVKTTQPPLGTFLYPLLLSPPTSRRGGIEEKAPRGPGDPVAVPGEVYRDRGPRTSVWKESGESGQEARRDEDGGEIFGRVLICDGQRVTHTRQTKDGPRLLTSTEPTHRWFFVVTSSKRSSATRHLPGGPRPHVRPTPGR